MENMTKTSRVRLRAPIPRELRRGVWESEGVEPTRSRIAAKQKEASRAEDAEPKAALQLAEIKNIEDGATPNLAQTPCVGIRGSFENRARAEA